MFIYRSQLADRQRRTRRAASDARSGGRRGVSMIMVNVSISMTLVLSYAFIQTQSVNSTIGKNMVRRDLAGQAAQTGATVGLQTMQSASWAGVDTSLSGVIGADAEGTTSYAVTFLAYQVPAGQNATPDAAQLVRINSTGKWQSASNSAQTAQRTVEVLVRLQPRFPDRPVASGDYAAAEDVATNPGGYDAIQTYVLFTNDNNGLNFDPGDRFEGNLFLGQKLSFYTEPNWGSSARTQALKDMAARFTTVAGGQRIFQHPHPISGSVTFGSSPASATKTDLANMGVPYSTASQTPAYPSITASAWQQYQLFAGGFTYSAQTVSSGLSNVTLQPSPTNPLGIFYCSGSISIYDNVTIIGTLFAGSNVTIYGKDVQISSYNWRGAGGAGLVPNVQLCPRLPAIVANQVTFDDNTRTIVEGAIAVKSLVTGAGGTFEYQTATEVNITGTATSAPQQQPTSLVQLAGTPNLTYVTGGGSYSIWLQRGTSGNWYPIASVNTAARQLTVLGEVRNDAPTNYQIRRNRVRYVDVRGPISGTDKHDINCVDAWNMDSSSWNSRYNSWQAAVNATPRNGTPPLFTAWLAEPLNWLLWGYPYWQYGLTQEPTFHASRSPDNGQPATRYIWAPPLYQSYQSSDSGAAYAGYRWSVVSWRAVN